jgi:anti-sigma B factor antagonist
LTEQLTVQLTTLEGHAVVSACGEIDMSSAPMLRAVLDTAIENGARRLVVDLQGVLFMDSTGLNLLIAELRRLGPRSICVVARQTNILRLFEITGITTVIPVFDSVTAAVAALSE